MSLRSRQSLQGDTEKVPGPGQYTPKDQRKAAPAYSMSGRPETKTLSSSPGPGAYSANDTRGKGPVITMAPKTADLSKVDSSPGPAQYSVAPKAAKSIGSGLAFSLSFRSETKKNSDIVPGPGAYDAKPTVVNLSASLKGRNFMPEEKDKTPGPGNYDIKALVGRDGPSASMKSRHAGPAEKLKTPGPGSYSLPTALKTQGKSMSSRTAYIGKSENLPGPGAYSGSSLTVKKRAPSYSLSFRLATAPAKDSAPGPGAYQLGSSVGLGSRVNNAVSIKGRLNHKDREITPGPQYDPKPTGKPKAPSYSMGGGHGSMFATTNQSPGPGAYDSNRPRTVPAPTLKGRPKDSGSSDKAPGPGAYTLRSSIGEGPKSSLSFRTGEYVYADSRTAADVMLSSMRSPKK